MKTPQSTRLSLLKAISAWIWLFFSIKTLKKVLEDESKDRFMVALQGVNTGVDVAWTLGRTKDLIKAVRGRHE